MSVRQTIEYTLLNICPWVAKREEEAKNVRIEEHKFHRKLQLKNVLTNAIPKDH